MPSSAHCVRVLVNNDDALPTTDPRPLPVVSRGAFGVRPRAWTTDLSKPQDADPLPVSASDPLPRVLRAPPRVVPAPGGISQLRRAPQDADAVGAFDPAPRVSSGSLHTFVVPPYLRGRVGAALEDLPAEIDATWLARPPVRPSRPSVLVGRAEPLLPDDAPRITSPRPPRSTAPRHLRPTGTAEVDLIDPAKTVVLTPLPPRVAPRVVAQPTVVPGESFADVFPTRVMLGRLFVNPLPRPVLAAPVEDAWLSVELLPVALRYNGVPVRLPRPVRVLPAGEVVEDVRPVRVAVPLPATTQPPSGGRQFR